MDLRDGFLVVRGGNGDAILIGYLEEAREEEARGVQDEISLERDFRVLSQSKGCSRAQNGRRKEHCGDFCEEFCAKAAI